MPSHEHKQCPRCNNHFECKTGTILLCQCQRIYLSEDHLEYINNQFNDCLCLSCLKQVRAEYENQKFANVMNRLMNKNWR